MLSLALSLTLPGVGRLQKPRPLLRKAFDLFGRTETPSAPLHARVFSSSSWEGEDSSPAPGSGFRSSTRESRVFDWKTNRPRNKFLSALQAYKQVKGDLLVPNLFVVPTDDTRWPELTRGYRLGQTTNYVRTKLRRYRRDVPLELKELGFTLDAYQYRWDEIILPAFRKFYEIHGHTDVPDGFKVPTGDDAWPKQSWSYPLGTLVNNIRTERSYSAQVAASMEELKSMDFCFTTIVERDWTEKILPSLRVFRQEFGHCIIDLQFKVPFKHPWPIKAWGLSLGKAANYARLGHSYTEQSARDKDILDELDFAWDYFESKWKIRIVPALEVFVVEYGHCRVAQKFVVPDSDPWPRRVWGMTLGTTITSMQSQACYLNYAGRDVDRLQALGYHFKLSKSGWNRRVAPLLEIFATRFGHKHIPMDFIIPSEAPWPKLMWGVELGYIVARNSSHLPLENRQKLV